MSPAQNDVPFLKIGCVVVVTSELTAGKWVRCRVDRLYLDALARVVSFDVACMNESTHFLGLRAVDCGLRWKFVDGLRTTRPLVYIAGPFRAGPFRADTPWEIEQNIRRAEEHGLLIAKLGGVPVIPHTMYRFYQNSLPDAFWLEAGLTLLRICNVVAVCVDRTHAQESAGTQSELKTATALGMSHYFNVSDGPEAQTGLRLWIENWIKEHE